MVTIKPKLIILFISVLFWQLVSNTTMLHIIGVIIIVTIVEKSITKYFDV